MFIDMVAIIKIMKYCIEIAIIITKFN